MDHLIHIPRPAALGGFAHHHRGGLGHPDGSGHAARAKAGGDTASERDFASILDRLIAR